MKRGKLTLILYHTDAQKLTKLLTIIKMRNNIHVTHRADKSWAVVKEGNSRALGLYDTQAAAIKIGRKIAINNNADLLVHDRNNMIRRNYSYGDES